MVKQSKVILHLTQDFGSRMSAAEFCREIQRERSYFSVMPGLIRHFTCSMTSIRHMTGAGEEKKAFYKCSLKLFQFSKLTESLFKVSNNESDFNFYRSK